MKAEKLVKILRENFGDRVIVNSEYHIQVDSSKGKHDIWLNKNGSVKFKGAGSRAVLEVLDFSYIVKVINKSGKTHVEKMREMLNVAQIVNNAEKQALVVGNGVFTDAGWKDGTARIAAVMVVGDDITAKAQTIQCESNNEAEKQAIILGLAMCPKNGITIYNDNQSTVEEFGNPRVKWLPRSCTKAADKMGNMRK